MGMSSPAATYILLRDKTVFRIRIRNESGYTRICMWSKIQEGTDDPLKKEIKTEEIFVDSIPGRLKDFSGAWRMLHRGRGKFTIKLKKITDKSDQFLTIKNLDTDSGSGS
jgi:hypothetical protein